MKRFNLLYALISTLQQIAISIIMTLLSKTISILSFSTFTPSPTFLLILPHILSFRFNFLFLPSLTLLTIQNCYLYTQLSTLMNNRLTTIFSMIFKLQYREPIIFLIGNLLLDVVVYLVSRFYKSRYIAIIFNMIVALIIIHILKFNGILAVLYLGNKVIGLWAYFVNGNENENAVEIFAVCMMYVFFNGLFYMVHSGVFIAQLNYN